MGNYPLSCMVNCWRYVDIDSSKSKSKRVRPPYYSMRQLNTISFKVTGLKKQLEDLSERLFFENDSKKIALSKSNELSARLHDLESAIVVQKQESDDDPVSLRILLKYVLFGKFLLIYVLP